MTFDSNGEMLTINRITIDLFFFQVGINVDFKHKLISRQGCYPPFAGV